VGVGVRGRGREAEQRLERLRAAELQRRPAEHLARVRVRVRVRVEELGLKGKG